MCVGVGMCVVGAHGLMGRLPSGKKHQGKRWLQLLAVCADDVGVDRAERGPTEGEKHPAPSRRNSRPDRISEQPRAPTTARGAKGCDADRSEAHGAPMADYVSVNG